MDPLRLKVNLTTTFMLPLLYSKSLKHSDILTDTFINAYIADLNKPEYDSKLLIRYESLVDLPDWVKDYPIYEDEGGFIMVMYNIPDDFSTKTYEKFMIGDYSKFTNKYKKQVLNFWEVNEDTLLYGVLYKTGEEIKKFCLEFADTDLDMVSKEMEYWKPPNLKQEIFGMTGD